MSVSSRAETATSPQKVMRVGVAMMLVLLLMPLAFWLQKSLAMDGSVPPCDAGPVLKQLRAATSSPNAPVVIEAIRDIHSVGFDAQIGHRICMATLGEGAQVRQLKFAISVTDSNPGTLRVEAVSD